MGNKMLIDAAHPEETRVVVLRGNRIEEFDFEAANKKQLRGNIYLAKVTRVEPSLQAAFIEYGGNRHGFLAFSEIHPDYYQIPVADRQALLEDEARSAREDEDETRGQGPRRSRRHRRGGQGSAEKRAPQADEAVTSEAVSAEEEGEGHTDAPAPEAIDDAHAPAEGVHDDDHEHDHEPFAAIDDDHRAEEAHAGVELAGSDDHDEAEPYAAEPDVAHEEPETVEALREVPADRPDVPDGADDGHDHGGDGDTEVHEEDSVEQLGGDALEDVPHRVTRPRRNYKIQEVIKRRQVLLVQVVKEERGNKGAALTTYLSLAGRYSVLMPNTARGGGISRKIVDPEDRKRLKAIAQELEVPDGMGIILRTAGAARGMPEVKRDFEYLMRMWETVRETTLQSTAPTLVYEEGSLIKRSIRDLFTKDVDEVVVAGEEGYREAVEFMRLLMPNQVRNVVSWRDPQPIFAKAGAEAQLDAMFSNQVTLKSGGYLVINQTEALVAIDVNSGRSTREHNIEDTALRTNLEAADEIARQLRLRDLAGLIVVDFIDMEEGRNDRSVERRLKDALKNDRARIQIGRISHFGLLEMSRQRMRTGVLEGSTVMCPHCAGSGTVRSVSSMALHVLRLLEDALIRSAAFNLIARTRSEVAIYILNQKRLKLLDLESRFGVAITVLSDPGMTGMVYHAIERGSEATPPQFLPFRSEPVEEAVVIDEEEVDDGEGAVEEAELTVGEVVDPHGIETARPPAPRHMADADGEGGRRRRRRRRRRGRDGQVDAARPAGSGPDTAHADLARGDALADGDDLEDGEVEEAVDFDAGIVTPDNAPDVEVSVPLGLEALPEVEAPAAVEAEAPVDIQPAAAPVVDPVEGGEVAEATETPRRRRPRRSTRAAETASADAELPVAEEPAAPPRRARRPRGRAAELPLDVAEPSADRDIEADTVRQHPAEPELPLAAAPPAEGPATPAAAAASAADVQEPVEASPVPSAVEPDPDRPKRSGWWQRAKATFSAGS